MCSYPENIMPDSEGVEPKTMTIGTNNVFEVGCGILIKTFSVVACNRSVGIQRSLFVVILWDVHQSVLVS